MKSNGSLPDFFVLGAAKCGTTSLYCYLKQHPDLHLPDYKEPHVLNEPEDRFRRLLEDYRALYAPSGSKPSCDGTPSYFRDANVVIPRIKRLYGDESPKFVLIFRDPVERAFSHYLHKRRAGVVPDTFEEALETESRFPEKSREEWKSYFQDGLYADELRKWQEHFPNDNFHVLILNDLVEDAQRAVGRVFRFLDVNPEVRIRGEQRRNSRQDIRSTWLQKLLRKPSAPLHSLVTALLPKEMRSKLRGILQEMNQKPFDEKPEPPERITRPLRYEYRESVEKLENMIGRDLSQWLPEQD
jgi:hypothetical protein